MEIVEKEAFINNLIIFIQVTQDSVIDETNSIQFPCV